MNNKKEKMKYSLWSNLRFIFDIMWGKNARMTVLTILRAPFIVVIPLLGIYLSQMTVSLIESGNSLNSIAANIAALCGFTALCMVILNYLNVQNRRMEYVNSNTYQLMIFSAMMSHDYEYNESPKGLSDAKKALDNCGSDNSGGRRAMDTISSFLGNCIGIISYAAVIISLSSWIFIIISSTTIVSYLLLRRITAWNHKNKDNWLPIDRKREYLEIASKDLAPAKDIRLYNMASWLRDTFSIVIQQRMKWQLKDETHGFGIELLCALLSFVREGSAYLILVYIMYQKNLSASDFVLYFGVIAGFTAWFDGLTDNLYWLNRINVGYNEMREYIDHEDKSNNKSGLPIPKESFSIEFKNVSYSFTESDREIFKNFNLTIKKGEKLALVGLNGAGKTTLVKLICGLYRPTSGVILVDGKPIDTYNIDEYQSLFSAVFQEISVLPLSIQKNIACETENIDDNRLSEAMKLSGFDSVIQKLEKGADTNLIRDIYHDATDLSGGELQKLALARVIYRRGKFLILDEPTAALDPIAESNIYSQYEQISSVATSVFISHRLASTRFCDRIIFLKDGKIAEEGTHSELMARKGEYYDLFEIQSHYYKEEVTAP